MTLRLFGAGGAFSRRYGTTCSMVTLRSGQRWLIDCGRQAPDQLHSAGFAWHDITGQIVTHVHGDHVYGLEEADERVAYVYDTLARCQRALATATTNDEEGVSNDVSPAIAGMLPAFVAALRDDLNTAAAIAALSESLREVNRQLEFKKKPDIAARRPTLARFLGDMRVVSQYLGVFAEDPAAYLRQRRDRKAARQRLDVAEVERLLRMREDARAKKDWKEADRLRAELGLLGVTPQDTAEGSTWTL